MVQLSHRSEGGVDSHPSVFVGGEFIFSSTSLESKMQTLTDRAMNRIDGQSTPKYEIYLRPVGAVWCFNLSRPRTTLSLSLDSIRQHVIKWITTNEYMIANPINSKTIKKTCTGEIRYPTKFYKSFIETLDIRMGFHTKMLQLTKSDVAKLEDTSICSLYRL